MPTAAFLPELKVEIALTGAVSSSSVYDTAVYDTALYADDFSYIDVTQWFRNASIKRGHDRSGRLTAGTGTFTFDNTDRRFSPANTNSPYNGNVVPWRRCRMTATAIGQTVFSGWVQMWEDDDQIVAGKAECMVSVVDLAGRLASTDVRGVVAPSETVGDRINRMVAATGALVTIVGVGTGIMLQAVTLDGSALDQINKAVLADGGVFFIDVDGSPTFISRVNLPTVYGSASVYSWMDITGTPSAFAMKSLKWQYDGTWVANRVVANRLGGPTFTITDESAVAEAGLRTRPPDSLKDLQALNDIDVDALTTYLLGRYSRPELLPSSIEADVMVVDYDQRRLAGIDINARSSVRRQFPGAPSAITVQTRVLSIAHRIAPNAWRCTVDLTPIPLWMITPPLYDTALYDTAVYA
jgi:hypothetical protein